jgi:hypothetical protein
MNTFDAAPNRRRADPELRARLLPEVLLADDEVDAEQPDAVLGIQRASRPPSSACAGGIGSLYVARAARDPRSISQIASAIMCATVLVK